MMESQGAKHGGKRDGAGRKPEIGIARKDSITIPMAKEEKEQLKQYTKNNGFNGMSDTIRKLLVEKQIIKNP